jgi:hypothetical protein
MGWQVYRIVNEEGLKMLGPFKTPHMAKLRAEQNAKYLKSLGYDLVWYKVEEIIGDYDSNPLNPLNSVIFPTVGRDGWQTF